MPGDSEDVVFGNTVEALFLHALKERLTPRCLERASQTSGAPAYSRRCWS